MRKTKTSLVYCFEKSNVYNLRFSSNMTTKHLSVALMGESPRRVQVVCGRKLVSNQGVADSFFHDKESSALEELSYAISENKFLRMRMILICIFSNRFKFLFFQRKTCSSEWGAVATWTGRGCLISLGQTGRIGSPQPVISVLWFHLFFHSASLFWGNSSKAMQSPAAVEAA